MAAPALTTEELHEIERAAAARHREILNNMTPLQLEEMIAELDKRHLEMLNNMTPLQLEEMIAKLDKRRLNFLQMTPHTFIISSYLYINKMQSDMCKALLEQKRLSA